MKRAARSERSRDWHASRHEVQRPNFFGGIARTPVVGLRRHNNFPFYYHTDEPGKVERVVSGEHNYRHPLLMINVTDLVVRAFKIDPAQAGPAKRLSLLVAGRPLLRR